MARDLLAIPGTSVAVERQFSSTKHITTENRPLKPNHTTLIEELKQFLKFGKDKLFNYLVQKIGITVDVVNA